ncbi:uncharacterized protein LOC117586395 [Drosophila guanche]|uniref:Uncharacterized protein n=1 Tax=Drosophila guanche TaxID=7266 RepID=A0A3B0KJH8_DROGU|nr:uncharacterized protein LOC117586395 [Drosophila guanche]SPP83908.1 Hypothetical predicted protein [Drosophila guanche]
MSVLRFNLTNILAVLLLASFSSAELHGDDEQDIEMDPSPEPIDGRSFFFLGTLFRRWRNRWMAYHSSDPLFAGAAYPINGYYNCPIYGCNPAAIGPQPGYYSRPGSFYPLTQQQQQAQGNSNVYIYQTDQNTATSGTGAPAVPLGYGYFGAGSPHRPGQAPIPPILPPLSAGGSSAGAGSYGLGPGQGPGPGPIPIPQFG